ncbi:hypothetical protein NXS08_00505 [Gleimia sp. 6138-11-ORH1]|uniref:general stress protein n=1 Tax=Gleimia sp. 6138-11-ORH1 TaxID=2973937 RepID=UPI002166C7CF|nr:general stress protein [Gleimia sp. 6138-11-ORH1]MCS4483973.1 hypothetical protein [Gleimia sp. 6138-11-ORH1]
MNWDIDTFAKQSTNSLEVVGTEVAVFRSAKQAQLAIRKASEAGADLRGLRVIGSDLQSVLFIEGKVTTFKHLLSGMMSGLWISLFFAFGYTLLSTQVNTLVISLILAAGLFGGLTRGAIGIVTGRAAHQFITQKGLVAARYAITAERNIDYFKQVFTSVPGNLLRPETISQGSSFATNQMGAPTVQGREPSPADSENEVAKETSVKPTPVHLAPPQYGVRLPASEELPQAESGQTNPPSPTDEAH